MKHVCRNWSVNIGLMEVTAFLVSLTCVVLVGKKGETSGVHVWSLGKTDVVGLPSIQHGGRCNLAASYLLDR